MKTILITLSVILACVAGAYAGYFFVSPSVTVVNASSRTIAGFVVTLPSSRLDFGVLGPGESNTIYYSLTQERGVYSTKVEIDTESSIDAACGEVSSNELHKRVTITLTEDQRIVCVGA